MSEQSTWAQFLPATTPETKAPARTCHRRLDPHFGCPWCLAPPEEFRDSLMGRGCSVCEASLPVDVEWFKNGLKIVTEEDAARMYPGRK